METKRIKTFRTRLGKKSFEQLVNLAVKQYKSIITLTEENNALEKRIKYATVNIDRMSNKLNAQNAEVNNIRIRVENTEKTNAELYVDINFIKDTVGYDTFN